MEVWQKPQTALKLRNPPVRTGFQQWHQTMLLIEACCNLTRHLSLFPEIGIQPRIFVSWNCSAPLLYLHLSLQSDKDNKSLEIKYSSIIFILFFFLTNACVIVQFSLGFSKGSLDWRRHVDFNSILWFTPSFLSIYTVQAPLILMLLMLVI